ncbi:MFS transporter [Acidithiobacillus sp.]|jgi:MFS family permease|uniref:MFS transporter n=1 Tax=Acidithiobacillus sp. TaxID=1872118 RepID=UPI0025C5EEC9|nr:MFS transporter [Acidithiobacillus sp.]MCK9359823.1 MFS transporter [Acidithiobacillus sp.]
METTLKASLPPPSHTASSRGQAWVLAAVCLAALILPLSFTGGVVATPTISRDLGGSSLALNWITNAFMLSFGSLLMPAGALADAFGRKRLFASGVLAFSIASVIIAWAPNIAWLDVLRAVQGIAAATALAGGSAALAQEFDGIARTRAFSLLGTSFGAGLAFGPVLAGLLIEHEGWRSMFLSSAFVGTFALLLGVPRMRESRDPDAMRFDWLGAVSFTGTLGLFTWGVLQLPTSGWSSFQAWGLIGGSLLAFAVFLRVERRTHRPMLDLSLFRYPRFVGVQMLPVATSYCYVVLLVLLPLRLIGIEGRNEVSAGLTMIALSIPMLVMPSIAAVLTRWASAGKISAAGLLIAALGLFWLSCIDPSNRQASLLGPLLVIGVGTGLPWGLMDGLAVSVVPKERAGMATGIFSTTRVAGEGMAIAIVSALLTLFIQFHLPENISTWRVATAQHLAMGDMAAVESHVLDTVNTNALVTVYGAAFQWLIYFLILITVFSAMVVGWLLGDQDRQHTDGYHISS